MRATTACAVLFAGAIAVAAPVPKEKVEPPPAVTKEHISASQENLKRITLAISNYAATQTKDVMPTDITDKNGKALLSWRVAILLYSVDDHEVLREFKLDEPWDSENNKKLIAKVPKMYAPIRVKAKEGETFYQVFYGEGALYGPKQKPRLIPESIPDGFANTGLVFEAGDPVIWTKPADLPFDAKKALPKLGGLFDGEFNVGMCDGSVLRVKKDFDATELKKLITPAGNEVIDLSKLQKK